MHLKIHKAIQINLVHFSRLLPVNDRQCVC